MNATGTFTVELAAQDDASHPAGRMLISKQYTGDLAAAGRGQMLSKRIEGGAAVYFAIEEVTGALAGRTGGFSLLHRGRMDANSQSLDIAILEGSGSGELTGISGTMQITQNESGHQYELVFDL